MISSLTLGLTEAEKLQSLDLPMSLLIIGMGAGFVALRKKMAVARQVRVQKGELSADEAKKNDRLGFWGGWGVVACGLCNFVM